MPDTLLPVGDPTRLDGKTMVVTGAARGMGAAHVHRLTELGASVVAVDVDVDGVRSLGAELTGLGRSVHALAADVSSLEDWEAVRDATVDRFGGAHGLVNNAGIVSHRRIAQTEREGWLRLMGINLTGPFLGMKVFAPVLRESGGGAVVNVSSAAGLDHHPDPSYTASKWGLRGLTKAAAQELGPWGIRVNSIHPGYFDTPMNDFASESLIAAKTALLAAGRAGQPWEAAALVAFLLSDAAAFITGAEIAIDGGWTSGAQATEARRQA